MKITVTRAELRTMSAGFAKIVPGKSSIPALGCVRLDVRPDGLVAHATDLDQRASYRFERPGLEGRGSILLPFHLLKDYAKGAPDDLIVLATDDGRTVYATYPVAGHSVTTTLLCASPDDWPADEGEIPTAEAEGFLAAFRRVSRFTSLDASRPVLCGVHIDSSGSGDRNATLVATDGRRLTCCNSLKLDLGTTGGKDGKEEDAGVVVPATKFLAWQGLPGEASFGVSRGKTATRVCIRAGSWTYVVKTISGRYPNWRNVVPGEAGMTHRIAFTDAEASSLRQLLPTLPGQDAIALDGADGRLALRVVNDAGKPLAIPLASAVYEGGGCRLLLDRRHLLDALDAGFRNFLFADTVSPVVSRDGIGGMHVLMPMSDERAKPPVAESEPSHASHASHASAASAPAPATTTPTKQTEKPQEKNEMKPESPNVQTPAPASTPQPSPSAAALDALQASFEAAKTKLREAQSALVEVGASLRDAIREERQRRTEAESVRSTLRKLQSIRV